METVKHDVPQVITTSEDVGCFYFAPRVVASNKPTYPEIHLISGINKITTQITKQRTRKYESGRCIYDKTRITDTQLTIDSYTLSLIHEMMVTAGIETPNDAPEGFEYEDGGSDHKAPVGAYGYYLKLPEGYKCIWYFHGNADPVDDSSGTSDENGANIEPRQLNVSCTADPIRDKLRRIKTVKTIADVYAFFEGVLPAAVPTP